MCRSSKQGRSGGPPPRSPQQSVFAEAHPARLALLLGEVLAGTAASIVHFAVAAIMLRPGWMLRYLPAIVRQNVPEPVIVTAGYAWAALLAALGVANLVIALHFEITTWVWFISVGAVGAKLVAFALQYGIFRTIVRQRLARAAG